MSLLKVQQKKSFDVNDQKDLTTFANFLKTSTWGPKGCPFTIEEPWHSIPDMLKDKITRKHLGLK